MSLKLNYLSETLLQQPLNIVLQMKLVSIAYFLAFGIFVPLASYMIVYGLYLLRVYLFESAGIEAVAETLLKLPVSDLYRKVRAKMGARKLSLSEERRPSERRGSRRDSHVINVERKSTEAGGASRRSTIVSQGMAQFTLIPETGYFVSGNR